MSSIRDIIDRLGTSRAIFNVVDKYSSGRDLDFQLENKYMPTRPAAAGSDPVEGLVIKHYSEQFDVPTRRYEKRYNEDEIYRQIVNEIIDSYEQLSPLKNPKQTKLYKWLRSMHDEYKHPSSKGFIALYRYMHANATYSMTMRCYLFKDKHENPHGANVLAILEKMRDKYEA